jgi:hypothetical protein
MAKVREQRALLTGFVPACRRALFACHARLFPSGPAATYRTNSGVGATGEHNEVLGAVVIADAVDVVHVFHRQQGATNCALRYQAVLKHIAVAGSRWVLRGIHVNVAAFVLPTPALPLVAVGAGTEAQRAMAGQQWQGMPLEMPPVAVRGFSGEGRLTTAALTNAGRYLFRLRNVSGHC